MTNTTNQKDSSAKAMADTVQRLQGEPAARMAKLSQDSSATSGCLDKLEALANAGAPVALRAETLRDLIDLARRATPAPEAVPERCKHGVWAADHCYQCEPAATPSPEQGLIEAVRRDIIGFLRASTDYDAANRVEEFMTAQQIAKNISQQAAPAAPLDLSGLTLHYKEGVENGGYYLATDVIRLNGASPVAAPEAPASEQCTYPNCSCIGGGVFKPCVKHGAPPAATTASTSGEKTYTRAEVQQWRNDIAHAAADMVERAALSFGDGDWSWLINDIRSLASAPAPSREAAAQVKTWQERYSEARAAGTGPRVPMGLTELRKDAEIADLRAALAQQGAAQGSTTGKGEQRGK